MHSDELWSNNDYRYYLAHHQVKGAHWGVMNGPPYPLSRAISTGKRLKASVGNAIKKHKENKAEKVKAAEEAKKKAAEEAKRREEEQRRKEEKEKQDAINEAKKKAIASADVKEINKHMSDMSTNELADAVRRAELNKQLQGAEMNTTKFDRFMNRVDKTVKNVDTGVRAWNTLAKLSNAFGGTDLPIIGEFGRKNPSKEEDEAKRKQREKERKKDEEAKRKQREKDEASRRRYEERTRRQQDKSDIQKLKKLKSILSGAEFDKGSVDIIQAMLKAGWTREQIDSLTNNKNKQQAQHSAIFDEYVDEYLAHHGILGQKWGQKNGPPYPLDSGDHSASEKKAGWRKSLGGVFKKKTDNQLKANQIRKDAEEEYKANMKKASEFEGEEKEAYKNYAEDTLHFRKNIAEYYDKIDSKKLTDAEREDLEKKEKTCRVCLR